MGVTKLLSIFSPEECWLTREECWAYGYDNSTQHAVPDAVILPSNSNQIVPAIRLCHDEHIPFTARGRGTNTTGATVPVHGGVVCAMEKINRILEINPADRYMVVEPGITNQEVQLAAKKHGFFWPPDPTSSAYCTIGGNLACNAGGPRAIKYGTTRDNVLGLKAITGNGANIKTGTYTTKSSVGYDLTRLLIGSEGTLAVITEATLALTPLPEKTTTLAAYYQDIETATMAIARIMAQPARPSMLEFIDTHCLRLIGEPSKAQAMLLIEIENDTKAIEQAAKNSGLMRIDIARTEEEIKALWKSRKALSPALKKIAPKKINEDIVVPVSHIPHLLKTLDAYAHAFDIPIVCFGHAGNGNIHVNLLIQPEQIATAEACLDQIFTLVLSLRGSLSGEHGIGLMKRAFMSREIDPVTLNLMQAIKQQFDPHGILNPGKLFSPHPYTGDLLFRQQ